MSKIISTIDKTVYNSSYNLQSYSEKALQNWILKYKNILYPDYYCFQSGYNFVNTHGEKSAADLILIAKDFSEWLIVEVELISKQLTHTYFQLGVFTNLVLDIPAFSNHCQRKEPVLHKLYTKELEICLHKTPKVLVIFDYEDHYKIEEVVSRFPTVEIGYCELYQTTKHNATLIRIFGSNNYVAEESIYLTPGKVNKSLYEISNPAFFKKVRTSKLDFICAGRLANLTLIKIKETIKVKIDHHAFNEDAILILERSKSNQFFLKSIN